MPIKLKFTWKMFLWTPLPNSIQICEEGYEKLSICKCTDRAHCLPSPVIWLCLAKCFASLTRRLPPFLARVNDIPGLLTLTSMLKTEAAYSSQNITHARFQIVTVVCLLNPHTWRHHNPLIYQAPITQWHSLTSWKVKILYMIHNYRTVYHSLYHRASPTNWSTSNN